jgi:cytochrome P450
MSTVSATRSIRELPGPRGLPLIGSLHQTWRLGRSHIVIEDWADRYGPLYKFRVARRLMVVVSDPEEINRVLRERPEGFRRWREIEAGFQEIGFPGVFSVEGEVWRRQRQLVVRALNTNHLHRHFHAIRVATERLHRRLTDAARSGDPINVTANLTAYTVDVTSTLAFGHDLNTLEHGDGELQQHIQRTFKMLSFRVFFPVPYWRWIKLRADRELAVSVKHLHSAVLGFIVQARERMSARPELFEEPENFLEAMLAAQREDGTFTDEEIIGNVFALLLAGEDTTAHTMAWTSWFLAQHPDAQARWAQEASDVLGEAPYPSDPGIVANLPYGEAVLRESMRLKAVANGTTVEALTDTTIRDTRIPAGTRLILELRQVSRRAGGPEYRPERWLNENEDGNHRDGNGAQGADRQPSQKEFLAFGAGPRFCPGRNLAFLESKTAMAMIARNFQIELDESAAPVTEHFAFTMIPRGLRVRLRERTGNKPTESATARAGVSANADGSEGIGESGCPAATNGQRQPAPSPHGAG